MIALCFNSKSQDIKPRKVGDITPDIEFKQLINYKKSSVKLSDLKDKLVILEFWATWCKSCLAKFPESETVQNKFSDEVQIILVNGSSTGDNIKTINEFLDKRKKLGKGLTLPIAPEEDIANSLFQHLGLPHYVWIKNQQVLAITGGREMNEANIEAALKGSYTTLRVKEDFDKRNLFFLDTLAPGNQIARYSILFKGLVYPLSDGGSSFKVRMNDSLPQGVAFGNYTPIKIYQKIAASLLPESLNDPAYVKVTDNYNALKHSWEIEKTELDQWREENLISLEVYAPGSNLQDIYRKVLEELNSATDYFAEIKPTLTKCLVLQSLDSLQPIGVPANASSQPSPNHFSNLGELKVAIFEHRDASLPLVDKTGTNLNLPILKITEWSDWKQLVQTLAKNNLQIKEAQLTLPMLVVTQKDKL